MGQKVNIGGDRLGSGNKMNAELHNYYRSTHDLTRKFTSSMAAGVLYPFLVLPAMRGDKFTIKLHADARTLPTKCPLFGSFKMQVDIFQCPWRLYQAILHNNPTSIGLKMNQVYLPKLRINEFYEAWHPEKSAFANNSLMKYLGLSGIAGARPENHSINTPYNNLVFRNINAIPALAYYDIFKNYYSNKQEENAYVITGNQITEANSNFVYYVQGGEDIISEDALTLDYQTSLFETNIAPSEIGITLGTESIDYATGTIQSLFDRGIGVQNLRKDGEKWLFEIWQQSAQLYDRVIFTYDETRVTRKTLQLEPFPLSNIDDMRMEILSHNNLGRPFIIDEDNAALPYITLVSREDADEDNGHTLNTYPMNGLVVKTYQSDIFNNWIKTDWIDGDNGIAEITKIAVNDGAIKIDAINLAEKIYNMLNRIAVAGNTYEDWQDAVYTQSPRRHIESPIYLGGMSSEIMFEEIVQTAPAEGDPLGTLGGKGKLIKRKGGNVTVKVDEASFIIGIVSLTPRINYTQGNEWYLTELDTMDDLHKPALDGIGFQNLIEERLSWTGTMVTENGEVEERRVIGKVPAWIDYMTAYDQAYGDFAELDGNAFMTLNRNYDITKPSTFGGRFIPGGAVEDATTYIDPTKYNYAFAYTGLDAQNFWCQILTEIKARRLMSAKQIPNI